jgi:hypothetical protein
MRCRRSSLKADFAPVDVQVDKDFNARAAALLFNMSQNFAFLH